MNCTYHSVFLLSFVFLAAISVSSSLRCYVCNSKDNVDCASIVDNRYLKNCSEPKDGSNAYGCRKIEQWLDEEILQHKPEHRIIRQCDTKSDPKKDKGCIYRSGYGSRQNVCHCYDSDCNGASTLSVLSAMTLLFSFLFAAF